MTVYFVHIKAMIKAGAVAIQRGITSIKFFLWWSAFPAMVSETEPSKCISSVW